jgi:Mn2+/Fe2+ NRAMP family transporter
MMLGLIITNFGNVVAEFAGVATSLELFHISRFVSVPIAALLVWLLVVKGSYKSVEKVFLAASFFYFAYIIAGVLAGPSWREAFVATFKPPQRQAFHDVSYIYMVIGLVGTTIAPWMQFYLQAAVVEKGVTAKEYAESRIEVIVGCLMTSVIAFFIIVACAGAIWSVHPRDINDGKEAALGLKPFGEYAVLLFAAGLFNASIFAASILPLSTAYSVCEGMGFESGVNKTFSEAPVFYWLYTLLIAFGAGVILVPNFPLFKMILWSQVLNGVLLPFVLIFMILLINNKRLMNEWTNSRAANAIAWMTVIVMIGLTLALVGTSIKGMGTG